DINQYQKGLIQPAGQINRKLIESEWPNIQPIITALGLKEIDQSTAIPGINLHNRLNLKGNSGKSLRSSNLQPIDIEAKNAKRGIADQSTLIRKLCHYTADNRTRKAIFEYDKLIRSIYTLKYLQDQNLQRDVHRSQNR